MTAWLPSPAAFARPAGPHDGPDPVLERMLRRWLALGALAVLLVPALRGHSPWLGWWPLWLVAMPAAAWWALHRFRLPPAAIRALRRTRQRRRGRRCARRLA